MILIGDKIQEKSLTDNKQNRQKSIEEGVTAKDVNQLRSNKFPYQLLFRHNGRTGFYKSPHFQQKCQNEQQNCSVRIEIPKES